MSKVIDVLGFDQPDFKHYAGRKPGDILEKGALTLRAINHPLRRRILNVVAAHEEMSVTDIFTFLQLDQPVASQQISILRKAGLLSYRKDDKNRYYSVTNISAVMDLASQLAALHSKT